METLLHAIWTDDTQGQQYYVIREWDYWSVDGVIWLDSEGFDVDTDEFMAASVMFHGGSLDRQIYS